MTFLVTLIAFLLILGVLIFVHELGHFMVAKWMGMRVDEFAIGFPPRIWKKQKGETLYALNAIPFGGYVRIHGENPESVDDDPRSFENKPVRARVAVVIAGVVMNLLFAFIVLVIAFSVGFVSIGQDLTKVPGASVSRSEVIIADVLADGGAAKAGLKGGDLVKSFENPATGEVKTVATVQELTAITKTYQELGVAEVKVNYERAGKAEQVVAQVARDGAPLGIYIQPFQTVRVPVWQAPVVAVKEIGIIIDVTWEALKGFGARLFQAELDPNVSGPVGIYQATGSATKAGLIPTIFLVVALSVNLALLNILPIPALDGGKLLFLLVEGVARKRIVARRLEAALTFTGFVLLIGLILVLSVRDVARLF